MMTAAEQIEAGFIRVDAGWVTLRNGRRLEDDYLYPSKEAAEKTARWMSGVTVAPAKRVWTIRRRRPDWIIGEAP